MLHARQTAPKLVKRPSSTPRPTLAWIGPAPVPPRALSDEVTGFGDSDDFLLSPEAFGFDFYVVQLAQQGVRGVDLIRLIRRRSVAGIVAIGDAAHDEFVQALDCGADMVLPPDPPTD